MPRHMLWLLGRKRLCFPRTRLDCWGFRLLLLSRLSMSEDSARLVPRTQSQAAYEHNLRLLAEAEKLRRRQ